MLEADLASVNEHVMSLFALRELYFAPGQQFTLESWCPGAGRGHGISCPDLFESLSLVGSDVVEILPQLCNLRNLFVYLDCAADLKEALKGSCRNCKRIETFALIVENIRDVPSCFGEVPLTLKTLWIYWDRTKTPLEKEKAKQGVEAEWLYVFQRYREVIPASCRLVLGNAPDIGGYARPIDFKATAFKLEYKGPPKNTRIWLESRGWSHGQLGDVYEVVTRRLLHSSGMPSMRSSVMEATCGLSVVTACY
eukprot:gnl/TRDRNA2_/TRDRNA2_97766_c1_seq1.p1 gnl/TRDRNA2_/TRDRNA2_97766_c1~~gnl/TRDRNA2_/TRDRNA2_97766_c1_seq1.p1  ORF type:complete len:277 (-),score=11.27 gnl/TRDRNA2_/TRDRNA2_97766_c1_seq1:261-1016(-)